MSDLANIYTLIGGPHHGRVVQLPVNTEAETQDAKPLIDVDGVLYEVRFCFWMEGLYEAYYLGYAEESKEVTDRKMLERMVDPNTSGKGVFHSHPIDKV